VVYPKFSQADIMVLLSERSYDRVKDLIGPLTKVIYNTDFIKQKMPKKYQGFAFDTLANELGNHRVFNMLVLGQLVRLMDSLPLAAVIKQIHISFAAKYTQQPQLKTINEVALNQGYNLL